MRQPTPGTSPPIRLSGPRPSHTNLFGTSMFLETGLKAGAWALGSGGGTWGIGPCGSASQTSSTLQQICNFWSNSQTVTLSSTQLCCSTSPVHSCPPYHTWTWGEKNSNTVSTGGFLPNMPKFWVPPATNGILWLTCNSRCSEEPASHLSTQTSHRGSIIPQTDLCKLFKWRQWTWQFLGFFFFPELGICMQGSYHLKLNCFLWASW